MQAVTVAGVGMAVEVCSLTVEVEVGEGGSVVLVGAKVLVGTGVLLGAVVAVGPPGV